MTEKLRPRDGWGIAIEPWSEGHQVVWWHDAACEGPGHRPTTLWFLDESDAKRAANWLAEAFRDRRVPPDNELRAMAWIELMRLASD